MEYFIALQHLLLSEQLACRSTAAVGMAIFLKLALCALLAAAATSASAGGDQEAQVRGSYEPGPIGGGGTTTTTTAATTANPKEEDEDISGDEVNAACLREMNKYRKVHGSQPLAFSKALLPEAEKAAQSYTSDANALELRPGETANPFKCAFVARPKVGDNIGVQFGIVNADNIAELVVANTAERWYQRGINGWKNGGLARYNYESPDFETLWAFGPFTQMLWNSTTRFACHLSKVTSGGNRILTAVFEPAGNRLVDFDLTSYTKNVKKPK